MRRTIEVKNNPNALYLVDSSIYIFRAWRSMPASIKNTSGHPANATHGFAHFIFDLLARRKPRLIAFAFDTNRRRNARKAIYPNYKANRPPTPADLVQQFVDCQNLVKACGIFAPNHHTLEADDLIGTLAHSASLQSLGCVIVSADKDLCQFVGQHDAAWDFARDVWLDRRAIEARFGVRPHQIADLLALTGDKVDNIPGVPGVGQATAARLLTKWGDIDTLLSNLPKVSAMKFRGAAQTSKLLAENSETIRIARKLTGLWPDSSLPADCQTFTIKPDYEEFNRTLDTINVSAKQRQPWLKLLQHLETKNPQDQ